MTSEHQNAKGSYFLINNLNMYYEVHGTGWPLVMMHGGMSTLDDFAFVIPTLKKNHQIITPERQGHGHTADIDRPFNFKQMADDTAALLKHLNIQKADFFGYSAGGTVALEVAIQHPHLVNKLVLTSTVYGEDGYPPEVLEGLKHASAEAMPLIMRDLYIKVAPHPEDWPKLIEKSRQQVNEPHEWQLDNLQKVQAPTLLIIGDKDIVRPEHARKLAHLLPDAQLKVLPDADHVSYLMHPDALLPLVTDFLEDK